MSIETFLGRENIQTLWDVLIDEPMIKKIYTSSIKVNELATIFETNIKAFFMREKNNCTSLVELNKKYMLLLINYVIKLNDQNIGEHNLSSQQAVNTNTQPTSNFKKIKIHHDESTSQPPITYEDIQNQRLSRFEKELNKKQEEFSNAITLPTPPLPDFSDKLDEPISGIELEIKKIQEQRNYDIELINKSYNMNNTNNMNNDNWLTSQETSIKNEKLSFSFKENTGSNANNNANANNTNVTSNEKHITWSNENKFYESSQQFEIKEEDNETLNQEKNIFSKLKKVTTHSNYDENTLSLQNQLDVVKSELTSLNSKLNIILDKINNISESHNIANNDVINKND